jgi:hypothetical protein
MLTYFHQKHGTETAYSLSFLNCSGIKKKTAKFKYVGRAATNQICIYKEAKARLNSGNASYRSV